MRRRTNDQSENDQEVPQCEPSASPSSGELLQKQRPRRKLEGVRPLASEGCVTVPMMGRRCLCSLWPSASRCFAQIATTRRCQKVQVDQGVRRRTYGFEREKFSWSLRTFRNGSRLDNINLGIRRLSV